VAQQAQQEQLGLELQVQQGLAQLAQLAHKAQRDQQAQREE
jgi:hypothetical protein